MKMLPALGRKTPALGGKTMRSRNPFGGEHSAQLVPQTRLVGPMPWVIAIMVALTVIAAAGGLAISNVASSARAELAGGATVQIVEALASERNRQAIAVQKLLAEHPAVASVQRVSDEDLNALLEPWLGVGANNNEAVPVPALIDVRLRENVTEENLAVLRDILAVAAPAARMDAQSSWLGPVFSALLSLQWLAAALVILLGLTGAAAVWLAARSALGTNHDTIETVHLLGGTDIQIARVFERSIGLDAIVGGAAGLGLGVIAVLGLGTQFSQLGSGMITGGGLRWFDWFVIALVPLAGSAIAMLTARITVLDALRRML